MPRKLSIYSRTQIRNSDLRIRGAGLKKRTTIHGSRTLVWYKSVVPVHYTLIHRKKGYR
jgi:hypothetical protein